MSAMQKQLDGAGQEARAIVHVGLKDVTDWLEMASKGIPPPVLWCPKKSPKGHYVCIRSPHPDNENHVFKTRKRRDG
jgi:hypothetical protein